MTGLLGGGHAIYFDAATGRTANLDCFVAVPGLGREGEPVALLELEVPFGTELVQYAVGIGSCGVPGVPAGIEALWEAHGRLPWPRLVEPALRLARGSVPMPAAHAACLRMLEPVMTMNEGARIYSPGGKLLDEGDLLVQQGLVAALEAVAEEGARSAYDGTLARALLALMEERGGLVTQEDLSSYEALWRDPMEVEFRGYRVETRAGVSDFPTALGRLEELHGLSEPERALAITAALLGEPPAQNGTTNISALDDDGNACVLTTSLGLGSGDFVPGFDLHLNSMLGEADLLTGPVEPGERMASMMAPTHRRRRRRRRHVACRRAAGGTRLRSALLQVVAGILDEGLDPQGAVERPRLHPVASLVHVEPGFDPETTGALESAGFEVRDVAGPAPLLRRGQRRHAERRRGGSPAKRRGSGRVRLGASTQPTYAHSGQPGFARTVPPRDGFA